MSRLIPWICTHFHPIQYLNAGRMIHYMGKIEINVRRVPIFVNYSVGGNEMKFDYVLNETEEKLQEFNIS